MRKTLLAMCIIAAVLALSGCDIISSISGVIPELSTSDVNLLAGKYELPSSYEGHFIYQLSLNPDGSYKCIGSDGKTTEGSYKINYGHLDILRSSGTLYLSSGLDGAEAENMKFSFFADSDTGPESLILDSWKFSFIGR
ncbi:MAG: hypothetical protein WC117_11285 [Sphaerochaetaceae bacterium]